MNSLQFAYLCRKYSDEFVRGEAEQRKLREHAENTENFIFASLHHIACFGGSTNRQTLTLHEYRHLRSTVTGDTILLLCFHSLNAEVFFFHIVSKQINYIEVD